MDEFVFLGGSDPVLEGFSRKGAVVEFGPKGFRFLFNEFLRLSPKVGQSGPDLANRRIVFGSQLPDLSKLVMQLPESGQFLGRPAIRFDVCRDRIEKRAHLRVRPGLARTLQYRAQLLAMLIVGLKERLRRLKRGGQSGLLMLLWKYCFSSITSFWRRAFRTCQTAMTKSIIDKSSAFARS